MASAAGSRAQRANVGNMAIRDPGPPIAALAQVEEPTFGVLRRKVRLLGGMLAAMTLLLPIPCVRRVVRGPSGCQTFIGPVIIPDVIEIPLAVAWLASAFLWVPTAIALCNRLIMLHRLRRRRP